VTIVNQGTKMESYIIIPYDLCIEY